MKLASCSPLAIRVIYGLHEELSVVPLTPLDMLPQTLRADGIVRQWTLALGTVVDCHRISICHFEFQRMKTYSDRHRPPIYRRREAYLSSTIRALIRSLRPSEVVTAVRRVGRATFRRRNGEAVNAGEGDDWREILLHSSVCQCRRMACNY